MKSALCLFGIVGGRTGKDGAGGDADFRLCWQHYKKNIFDHNNIDVFIHTWSLRHQKTLAKLYGPKKAIYERQKYWNFRGDWALEKQNSFSRWYSTQQSLKLKKQYEQENNFKYDMVMLGRFDLMWFVPVKFDQFDPQYFYASHWNDYPRPKNNYRIASDKSNTSPKSHRLLDMWFLMGTEIADYVGGLYDNIPKIGNIEYDPHKLIWDWIHLHPVYKDKLRYAFYRWSDYEIYRWWVLHCFK
jgi:hypothetical protein